MFPVQNLGEDVATNRGGPSSGEGRERSRKIEGGPGIAREHAEQRLGEFFASVREHETVAIAEERGGVGGEGGIVDADHRGDERRLVLEAPARDKLGEEVEGVAPTTGVHARDETREKLSEGGDGDVERFPGFDEVVEPNVFGVVHRGVGVEVERHEERFAVVLDKGIQGLAGGEATVELVRTEDDVDESGDAFGVLERGGEDGHHLGEVVPASTTKRLVVPLGGAVLAREAEHAVEHAEDALVGGGVAAAGVGGEF